MKKTANYNLPIYEANDLPNLLDGYNSAMDLIDSDLKAVSDFVQSQDKQIVDLSSALNSEVSRASEKEAKLENEINVNSANLESISENLSGKEIIVVMGDSFSDKSWQTYKIWADFFEPTYEVKNFAKSAAGFKCASDTERALASNTFVDQIDTAKNTLTESELQRVKFFILLGGVNDLNNANNVTMEIFKNRVAYFENKFSEAFSKQLYIFAPNSVANGIPIAEAFAQQAGNSDCQNVIINNPAGFLNGTRKDSLYLADNLHPNSVGQQLLFSRIRQSIFGGAKGHNFINQASYNFPYITVAESDTTGISVNHVYSEMKPYRDKGTLLIVGTVTIPEDSAGVTIKDQFRFNFGDYITPTINAATENCTFTIYTANEIRGNCKAHFGFSNLTAIGGTEHSQLLKLSFDNWDGVFLTKGTYYWRFECDFE